MINPTEVTIESFQEFEKCKNDIVYFAENFIYVDNDKIRLYDFQKELLNDWQNYRYNINIVARQMGLTTLHCIFILWNCLFTPNYIVAYILNKADLCQYIHENIIKHLDNIPNFIKIIVEYSKSSIKFVNGSKIIINTCSSESFRGQAVNLLIVDNPDHIRPSIFDQFWKSVIPTISSSRKGKFIISGSLGKNSFMEERYNDCEKYPDSHKNWKCSKIPWNLHLDRDEEWKNETMLLLGTNAGEIFSLEYDCKQWYSDGCPTIS